MTKNRLSAAFCLFLFLTLSASASFAGTDMERIKRNGVVNCGVRTTANAYAYRNGEGEWQGIDIEMCRLIATALLGRSDAIRPVAVNRQEGFRLLEEGKIDVLTAATPWTFKTDLNSPAVFPAVFYYSALVFLGHYNPDATSMKDYAGKKVCVEQSPFLIEELDYYNRTFDLGLKIMALPDLARAKELLYLKRCDLLFDRLETFHSDYFKKAPATVDLAVLPEIVRQYPTGAFIRKGDPELSKLVFWLFHSLLKAEEKGVSSQTVDDFQNTRDRSVLNLIDADKKTAQSLGVDEMWLYRTIAERGNYAEIYRRALGEDSPLKIKRTVNRLKKDGGLLDPLSFNE